MLERVNRKQRGENAASVASVPYLKELLQAVALEAHAHEERVIEERHVHAAAIRVAQTHSTSDDVMGIDLDKLLKVRDIVIAALPGEDMYGFTPDAGLPKGYGASGKSGWGVSS